MSAVQISELRAHAGQTVTLRGWVVTTRSSGKIAFVVLRDGLGNGARSPIQEGGPGGRLDRVRHADAGDQRRPDAGSVREEPRSPGGYELTVSGLELLGPSHEYPITPKEHGTTFLFEHRHLWLRSRRQAAIARVRHEVEQAIRDFFYQRGLHPGGHARS